MIAATVYRDLRAWLRNPGEILNPLAFFVIVISLFPLGIGPDAEQLRTMAPAVIWIAALLAMLLSLELMFRSDFDDGSLEQWLLTEEPLFLIVLGKVIAYWLLAGLPLALLSPLLCTMLFVPALAIPGVVGSLLLGTAVLSLLGAIGAALTVSLRGGGVLLAILVLPLSVPVLIMATAMAGQAMSGHDISGYALWLAAMLSLGLGLAPLAAAAALRVAVSE